MPAPRARAKPPMLMRIWGRESNAGKRLACDGERTVTIHNEACKRAGNLRCASPLSGMEWPVYHGLLPSPDAYSYRGRQKGAESRENDTPKEGLTHEIRSEERIGGSVPINKAILNSKMGRQQAPCTIPCTILKWRQSGYNGLYQNSGRELFDCVNNG